MKVALIVKNSNGTQEREQRNMGYWSYPVPEFEWRHFITGKKAYATDMNHYGDVIFQEDAGPYILKNVRKPVVYLAIDSTLSEDHLESRLKRAKNADLILVDHDDIERFKHLGIPVRQWNYCVNDHLFRDQGLSRDIDVSFYCGSNVERGQIRNMLRPFCRGNDISFATGTLHPVQYAQAMAQSKIVLNWPRSPDNRAHRVFDAMACGACLVTGPVPNVSGDYLDRHNNYVPVNYIEDIPIVLQHLLKTGDWQHIAQNGKRLVDKYHRWSVRAKQLKQILAEELL
jgi:glycosyltransferase involved in cell wall biosynthesis